MGEFFSFFGGGIIFKGGEALPGRRKNSAIFGRRKSHSQAPSPPPPPTLLRVPFKAQPTRLSGLTLSRMRATQSDRTKAHLPGQLGREVRENERVSKLGTHQLGVLVNF